MYARLMACLVIQRPSPGLSVSRDMAQRAFCPDGVPAHVLVLSPSPVPSPGQIFSITARRRSRGGCVAGKASRPV